MLVLAAIRFDRSQGVRVPCSRLSRQLNSALRLRWRRSCVSVHGSRSDRRCSEFRFVDDAFYVAGKRLGNPHAVALAARILSTIISSYQPWGPKTFQVAQNHNATRLHARNA